MEENTKEVNPKDLEQEVIEAKSLLNEAITEIEIDSRIWSFFSRKRKKRKFAVTGLYGSTILSMSKYQAQLSFDPKKLGSVDYLLAIKEMITHNAYLSNRIIACAVINNQVLNKWFGGLFAWYLMDRQTTSQLYKNYLEVETQADYLPFASTIVLMSSKRVTSPATEAIVEENKED